MKLPFLPSLLGVCAGLLAAMPAQAGCFAIPADGPVAFRLDRLPLDVDTMTGLAKHLCTLASGQGGENPLNRRTVAQMLALALALQPANPDARGLLETFAKGEPKPGGDAKQLEGARTRTWQIFAWLETAEEGTDAHALAACLGDVMAIADPQHPRAEAPRKLGEQGAWSGWVQPLEAFQKSEPVVKTAPPLPPPVRVPEAAVKNPILLASAMVTTPLWTTDKSDSVVLRAVPVQMTAKRKDGDAKAEPLSCSMEFPKVSAANDANSFKSTSSALVTALAKECGKLPAGVAVTLACGDNGEYLMDRNHSAVSGAAAVLLNAALAGDEPNATVIGEIQADGSFKLPPQFWEKLRSLADGPGGRLVLPQEAEKYLPSILTLEQAGFFFKYEILLAANLHELIQRCAKTPNPELAKITANFLEVRSKLGSQPVTEYAANFFVRQRLTDLARAASFHASARMLVIQGAGNRPPMLPRNVLAAELRRVLRPLAWIPSHPVSTLQSKSLNDAYEACNREVERLERCTEMRDREILTQVRDLLVTNRILVRATHGRSFDPKTFTVPWRSEFNAFSRSYRSVSDVLNVAAGGG